MTGLTIVATGPLTSAALSSEIARLTGQRASGVLRLDLADRGCGLDRPERVYFAAR